MNILLTINDISITGGAERVCINLANAFLERGFEAEILSFYRAHEVLPYATNAKIHFLHNESEANVRAKCYKNLLSRFYFKNLHKFALCVRIKRRFKADFVITNDFTFTPFVRAKSTRYIKIQHSKFTRYNSRNSYFDAFVVLSAREREIWAQFHKNIFVIPNFLPQMPQNRANLNARIILSAGRMDEGDQKGFLRLLVIWKIVQDSQDSRQNWQLVIVGDGALKGEIEAKIHALNLGESVALKPFTQNIAREYLSASIYAMASHFEGFPMALIEASSFALPCVAFDVKTGPSDIIAHEKSGVLVEDGDLQGFANALTRLMREDSTREEFGKNARKIVGEKFSKESVLQKWVDLFESK